eukprot:GHVO01023992.1.p1 GENE.GHVO01023992.1~~GHVO01023992.1.p1  ORF type:complete len:546 (-),score=119.49 GHVO01023992.1:76-1665(-)
MNVVPSIMKQGAMEEKGESARLHNFVGAIAIGDLMRTTLGPRAMDKILIPLPGEGSVGRKSTVTNDGATILKNVYIDNPAAKILVDLAKQQDARCGDGTTGVVVLTSEILKNAEEIVNMKIHQQIVVEGFRVALQAAKQALESVTIVVAPEQLKGKLMELALTTLSSKLLTHEREHFATLAVDAIMRIGGSTNLDSIQVLKKPGSTMRNSFLAEGFILEKKIGVGQPKTLKDCRVMVANTPMDTDKIKIYGARVSVDSFEGVREIEVAEKEKMAAKVDRIIAHGCNVFINRQLIYNYPDQLFKQAGVMSIEHSDFDGMERLARALGADIVSTFENPSQTKLGTCASIEEIIIGEEKLIKFSGCEKNEACTIVLRGANEHILDEAERSLHDALAVMSQTIQDRKFVPGGGAVEMAMAEAVENLAKTVEGKKTFAIDAVARALRKLPTIILDNAGWDSAEVIAKLRVAHHKGDKFAGIDIEKGDVGNMIDLGVLESYKSKMSQLCSALEASEMIVRVDDIIRCAPRQRRGM